MCWSSTTATAKPATCSCCIRCGITSRYLAMMSAISSESIKPDGLGVRAQAVPTNRTAAKQTETNLFNMVNLPDRVRLKLCSRSQLAKPQNGCMHLIDSQQLIRMRHLIQFFISIQAAYNE